MQELEQHRLRETHIHLHGTLAAIRKAWSSWTLPILDLWRRSACVCFVLVFLLSTNEEAKRGLQLFVSKTFICGSAEDGSRGPRVARLFRDRFASPRHVSDANTRGNGSGRSSPWGSAGIAVRYWARS